MYRFLFLIVLLAAVEISFAQSSEIQQLAGKLESNNDHEAVIRQAGELLAGKKMQPEDRLAIQTVLVHKYHELKQWDKCLAYCQQQVAEAHKQNDVFGEANFYKLIGNTYYHIPDHDRALEYWKKCIAISEASQYNLLLEQCYHNVGAVILESGTNLSEAEQNFEKAIALSILNKTDTTQLGNLHYRLLATLYEVSGRIEKAGELYMKVIERARLLNDSLRIAEALMFYAKVLVKEKKFDKAIQVGKEALLISGMIRKLDMEQTALDLLAESYVMSGNYKEAFSYLKLANNSFKQRFNTDLNLKISEAEARFRNAEIQHEKEMAIVKARKEKQLYLLGSIGLLAVAGFAYNYFYQKRNLKQKLQLQQQVQDEKERLSRDLHDNLGSQMALLSNNIEGLDTNVRKQQPIDENIERIKGTSRQLLQTLRETIWILNQEQLTAQDFFDKLVDYTHRYLQSYPGMQLNIEEKFNGAHVLNSAQALQLFRICQEAVTNTCKYSGSKTLLIGGNDLRGKLSLVIQDEGKGFDVAMISEEDHYGLKNMRQRAASIGASIHIEAAPGRGVSITIVV